MFLKWLSSADKCFVFLVKYCVTNTNIDWIILVQPIRRHVYLYDVNIYSLLQKLCHRFYFVKDQLYT